MEITLSSGYYWKHTQHFAGCQISCHRRERLTRGCREIPSCSCRKRNFWRTRAFTETTLHVPKQSSYFAVRVEPAGQAASQQDALIHTHHGSFKYPPKTYSRVKAASCCPGKWHFQPSHSASLRNLHSASWSGYSFLSGKRKELLFSLHSILYLGTIIFKTAIKTFSQIQPNRYCLQTGDNTPINRQQIQTTSKSRSLCVSFSACTSDLNLKVYLSDWGTPAGQQDLAETHC